MMINDETLELNTCN